MLDEICSLQSFSMGSGVTMSEVLFYDHSTIFVWIWTSFMNNCSVRASNHNPSWQRQPDFSFIISWYFMEREKKTGLHHHRSSTILNSRGLVLFSITILYFMPNKPWVFAAKSVIFVSSDYEWTLNEQITCSKQIEI